MIGSGRLSWDPIPGLVPDLKLRQASKPSILLAARAVRSDVSC